MQTKLDYVEQTRDSTRTTPTEGKDRVVLDENTDYFVSELDIVLRALPSNKSEPLNHLLLGDWLVFKGEQTTDWAKVSLSWLYRVDTFVFL